MRFNKIPYDLSGGLNEMLPANKIAPNEVSKLRNMLYKNGSAFPETRYGYGHVQSFPQTVWNCFGHTRPATSGQQNGMMIIVGNGGGVGMQFYGKNASEAATVRGTHPVFASGWCSTQFEGLLIFCAANPTDANEVPMKKWAGGAAAVANLGGSPPAHVSTMCTWNNRVFAVEYATNTILWSTLGDAEDWTDTDPVAGSGFVTIPDANEITSITAHKERMIITTDQTIWQIITSLPNTDPSGWRLELINGRNGCADQATVKPLLNDLIFRAPNVGIVSLAAVEKFGDFEMAKLSRNIYIPHLGNVVTARFFGASVGDRYFSLDQVFGQPVKVCDFDTQKPRWSDFVFMSTGDSWMTFINDGVYYEGAARLVFSIFTDLLVWPSPQAYGNANPLETITTDSYRDFRNVFGSVGASYPIDWYVRSRAWDNGNAQAEKRARDASIALKKLGPGAWTGLQQSVIYDEDEAKKTTFTFSDASSDVRHAKNSRLTGPKGKRFRSVQNELRGNEIGLGAFIEDLSVNAFQIPERTGGTLTDVGSPS